MAGTQDQDYSCPQGVSFERIREMQGGEMIFGGIAFIVGFWFFVGVFLPLFLGHEAAGQFGDTFGAMNGLVGGITLMGVAYAAYLQHEELKLAREQNKNAEQERKDSMAMLARQTEALLNAAQFQAVNAIGQMEFARFQYEKLPENLRFGSDVRGNFRKMNRHRQYAEILLNDFSTPDFDWGVGLPVEKRTPLRKFCLTIIRRAQARARDLKPNDDLWNSLTPFLEDLLDELYLLTSQPGGNALEATVHFARTSINEGLAVVGSFRYETELKPSSPSGWIPAVQSALEPLESYLQHHS